MRKTIIALFLACFFFLPAMEANAANVQFAKFFSNGTMRIDYYHMGDSSVEYITIDQIYLQGQWAGNPSALLDPFNTGQYFIRVYDTQSGSLIYSKGFNSYFGEYRTTGIAAKGIKRTYHESALIPEPLAGIKFTIWKRDRKNILQEIFSRKIDPKSVDIIEEGPAGDAEVIKLLVNGKPHNHVDLAILAEGYTRDQRDKFISDLKEAGEILFSQEPFKANKKRFNVYGVFKPSMESGCDEPRRGSFKATAMDFTFNSLGSTRYLLTESNRKLRDIAAHAPYDAVLIMVNSKRYGGGGIYNFYCVFTSSNREKAYLILHEFGHSFTNLADEYYSSGVAYSDFYPAGIEPTEANITALLKPAELKWKNLVQKGLGIPTDWEKSGYETIAKKFQQTRADYFRKIEKLQLAGAPEREIDKVKAELDGYVRGNSKKTDAFLAKSPMNGKVGAFEGAGYSAKGLFRPMLNCIMFTIGAKPYCKVCEAAVAKTIGYYSR